MNSISLRFYQELLKRVNQLQIRGNRHKVALYSHVNPDQPSDGQSLTDVNSPDTVFAFNVMFERNSPESEWRLVTPLRFTD